ncbi:MAG: PAS domain-containing protein, partial [Gemmatimonadaceae bacterium]|nr:PAS domain-containing protein [Gemmatimonadaceae bacterium]
MYTDSESHTQRLLKAAGVGLWDWNLQTNELYFSPEWKRQLGFDEHELADVFESWSDRLHPDDRHAAVTAASEFHAGIRARYDVEFRLRHKDGSYRWILAQADIRRDASGIP